MKNNLNDPFIRAMHKRFACKKYLDKPIEEPIMEAILEVGRLSPTSFGLEAWAFHVVQDLSLRKPLTDACFDQESVATAPVTLVIANIRRDEYDPYGPFVAQRGSRFPGTLEEYIDDYKGYWEFVIEEERIEMWSRAQGYIAGGNMMSAAAHWGIQSCAIEGFEEDKVAQLIGLDQSKWVISLLITLGYPDEPHREKIREPLEALVTYH